MNKITKIHTDTAPAAGAPYSGNRCRRHASHTSGQIALDPATGRNRRRRHQGSGRAGDEEPGSRSDRKLEHPRKM